MIPGVVLARISGFVALLLTIVNPIRSEAGSHQPKPSPEQWILHTLTPPFGLKSLAPEGYTMI